jgi:RimJ/RimL family protein N-acetyltransferase
MKVDCAIRKAFEGDLPWLFTLIPRLHEFGPPPWRDIDRMASAQMDDLRRTLSGATEGGAVLIAESFNGTPGGFVHLKVIRDLLTDEDVVHIAHLIVAANVENRGVARTLILAGEDFARGFGCHFVSLNVFCGNTRARQVYHRFGFREESIRMLKPL